MCHGGERKAIGAELLNDISELLPACFVCCPIESFKNTKLKKMKGIPNNKNFLKNFLPLTANVFFLLKIKKAQISVDISCSRSHLQPNTIIGLFSPSKTHRLSFPHRVLLYVARWPLCPAINREILHYTNHIIDNNNWQIHHDSKLTSSSSVRSTGFCMKMRFFPPPLQKGAASI